MRRALAAAAMLAALGSSLSGSAISHRGAALEAADRASQRGLERQDRTNGPGAPLGPMERLAARMHGGGRVGGPGGYRKRPRGTHKQNRRKALAARGRR